MGLLALLLVPAAAFAQGPWSVRFGADRSAVTNEGVDTTWGQQVLTLAFAREEEGGWRVVVERQERSGIVDYAFTTGGYLRMGDWTLAGSAALAADADFWFQRAFDAELSRRVVGPLVASVAYRYMDFAGAEIHQTQSALTYYHARGEVEARAFGTRNATLDRDSFTALARTTFRVNPRLALSGVVAKGDRIFDIASLPKGRADAWTVWGGLVIRVSDHDEITLGGGMAREEPSFEQRTVTVAYRRLF